jgi:hypothetical protein
VATTAAVFSLALPCRTEKLAGRVAADPAGEDPCAKTPPNREMVAAVAATTPASAIRIGVIRLVRRYGAGFKCGVWTPFDL